jgi:hypothetical protein
MKIGDTEVEYSPGSYIRLRNDRDQILVRTAAEVLALSEVLRLYGRQMEETEMAAHVRQYARRTPP